MIDISKIKPGDKVTLAPLEVSLRSSVDVKICVGGFNLWVKPDQIAAHHPAPREIGVGDRVRSSTSSTIGTVRGVDGLQAWVRWSSDKGANYTHTISDLTLVEGDQ